VALQKYLVNDSSGARWGQIQQIPKKCNGPNRLENGLYRQIAAEMMSVPGKIIKWNPKYL